MSRTIESKRHKALALFIRERRKKAEITQAELAGRLKRPQSFVHYVEKGQRRIDVVELLDFAEALGFRPGEAIKRLATTKRD
jgi:transcriptional regulator with XRE-family HTH domain